MPTIRPLPPLVVNQIAAGEVVERPASVVKELVENAVDAGASRVDVAIEDGGASLVRVVDDGGGIAPDELALAVTNHATSKIAAADDLFRVGTLGFRGEALASIASVSRLVIRSRQEGAQGAEIAVRGGVADGIAPAGCAVGTTVEVRDLFYNTPVRRKFLRTTQTEAAHAVEALARVALANPRVHFTLSHNGRAVHDLPPCPGEDGLRDRVAALHGDELARSLIAVASVDEREDGRRVTLEGYVAPPSHARSDTRLQLLLVNGRAIRDRSLQHALGEAYRGLLLHGRKPICFLRLTMPLELVDVNVHPQKLEVRFAESGPLYSQLLGTLRTRYLSADLREGGVVDPATSGPADDDRPAEGRLVEWARTELTQRRLDDASAHGGRHGGEAAPFRPFSENATPLALHRFVREGSGPRGDTRGTPAAATTEPAAGTASGCDQHVAEPTDARRPLRAMQLHNRYLVVEHAAGMEVVDQHALHERVLYEQLRQRALDGPLESQRLLTPEPVDLTPAEAAAVAEHADALRAVGLDVRPFGGDTVLVHAFPAMLRRFTPGETLRELAAGLVAGGPTPSRRDVIDELLHSMSCKAAVKYGDSLTEEEVAALLAARPETENHHHCPHGRPTSLVLTRDELDRRFQRT